MNGKYTINVTATKLPRPIGNVLSFVAKATVYEKITTGEKIVDHNFGETWGKTPEEAELRMHTIVDKWIREQDEK